jgi:ribosomal protein S27E
MSDFKKEYKSFMDDIEKNVTNPEDLEFVKGRVADLFTAVLDEVERIANYKEEKINLLTQNQQKMEMRMDQIQKSIENMEKELYIDDEEDFDIEIVCPYCDNEFIVDMDEDRTEVTCPECNNVIELDWSGDCDDYECSDSGCSHCHGCCSDDEDEEDM